MAQQRPFTVFGVNSEMKILWTRSASLARSWAADNWNVDPILITVVPTTQEDQEALKKRGQSEIHI